MGRACTRRFGPKWRAGCWTRSSSITRPSTAVGGTMAETEISIMNSQCLDRRLDDPALIAREVAAWEDKRNDREARIHWTFTLAAARHKLRKLYPSIED